MTSAFCSPLPLALRRPQPLTPSCTPHQHRSRPRSVPTAVSRAADPQQKPAPSSAAYPPPWPARPATPTERSARSAAPATIACVGDVHGQWNANDESALLALAPDLVLFVGDYGDEDIEVTRRIARFADAAPFGVATVFGNHDAHYTASQRRRERSPYGVNGECRVSTQMQHLSAYDVSYRSAAFDKIALSVCGGRSFSWGGPQWKHAAFFRRFFNIHSIDDSAAKISTAATDARFQTVVFLSHSGPAGLGNRPKDPCGKDWGDHPGGDYGDADLRTAIENARQSGMRVSLTVFGHMHQNLQAGQGRRVMVKTEADGPDGRQTVMLNAAVVPRHRQSARGGSMHHFQIVKMVAGGDVESVEETWLSPTGVVLDSEKIYEAEGVVNSTPTPN